MTEQAQSGRSDAAVGTATGMAALPEQLSPWRRRQARLLRHVAWARRDGVARLVEEDQLDPRERIAGAYRRWQWRRAHGVQPGEARAVFLVGVQRSGTNMIVRGLETMPQFEVRNENDRSVFERFQLRSDDTVRAAVLRSRQAYVLFKPLCDSHRTNHLLDGLDLPSPRAVWAYRTVDGRVRSAVAKFGDVNRTVMAEIAAGRGLDRWQAQGLSEETLDLVRSVDPAALSPEDGAALFWLVRNQLYFEQGLDRRDDVLAVAYDAVTADPGPSLRALTAFLDFPYDPAVGAHVDARPGTRAPRVDLDPRVRAACDALTARLDAAAAADVARWVPAEHEAA